MAEDNFEFFEEEEDTQKGKYMTFKSGNEYFGIELQYICEIIQFQNITEVPETDEYIKGLINLRGKIIPVIDVRLRFRQAPIEYNDRTCIIIINVKSTMVGLIVEKIEDVVKIDEAEITPPPSLSSSHGKNKYVYGLGRVNEKVKLLLDPEKLLNDEELEMFEELASENALEEN